MTTARAATAANKGKADKKAPAKSRKGSAEQAVQAVMGNPKIAKEIFAKYARVGRARAKNDLCREAAAGAKKEYIAAQAELELTLGDVMKGQGHLFNDDTPASKTKGATKSPKLVS